MSSKEMLIEKKMKDVETANDYTNLAGDAGQAQDNEEMNVETKKCAGKTKYFMGFSLLVITGILIAVLMMQSDRVVVEGETDPNFQAVLMMPSDRVVIKGKTDPEFQAVRDEFQKLIDDGFDQRSQIAVYVGDKLVVDLFSTNNKDGYSPDHVQNIWSSGKSVASILMGIMADKGLLDWNAPVTKYWPEFKKNNKGHTKVKEVMRHEAGLEFLSQTHDLELLTTENIKKNVFGEILENETQMWFTKQKYDHPNTAQERHYHPITRDLITNEIFRRVEPTGRTFAEYLNEEFPELNVHSGIDDTQYNVQDIRESPGEGDSFQKAYDRASTSLQVDQSKLGTNVPAKTKPEMVENSILYKMYARMAHGFKSKYQGQPGISGGLQTPFSNAKDWRAGEIFSANVEASARGLAKLGTYMSQKGQSGDKRIMSEESWETFHGNVNKHYDVLFGFDSDFSNGGVNAFQPVYPESTDSLKVAALGKWRDGYKGWMGFGGSVFQWHPELKISFAYVPSDLISADTVNSRGAILQGIVKDIVTKMQQSNVQ